MGSPLATDQMRRAYRPGRREWVDRCLVVGVMVAGLALNAVIVGLVMLVW